MEVMPKTFNKTGIHIGSYTFVLLNFLNLLRNRITYMCVHVLLNSLNELEKSDIMRGFRRHVIV